MQAVPPMWKWIQLLWYSQWVWWEGGVKGRACLWEGGTFSVAQWICRAKWRTYIYANTYLLQKNCLVCHLNTAVCFILPCMKQNSRSVNLFSVMSTSIVRLLLASHHIIFGLSLEWDIVLLSYNCGSVIVDMVILGDLTVKLNTQYMTTWIVLTKRMSNGSYKVYYFSNSNAMNSSYHHYSNQFQMNII